MLDNSFIITPDRFQELATNLIARHETKLTFNPSDNIIFLHGDNMRLFMTDVLPKITYKFILITHDADAPVTEDYLDILNNQYLVKWFGMNCHILHDKLFPIPIGMANEIWPHGNKEVMTRIISERNIKTNLVYCNFAISTNATERYSAYQELQSKYFIDFETQKLTFEEYVRKLSTYKYVISPPGNSVDCHRIWESMYVYTIPICKKSIPLVSFKDCPIMFINSWREVTSEYLEEKYDTIIAKDSTKSDFNYYKNVILELASSINNI